jgi:ABC-type lipoprotein export system ATPase subunit
MVVGKAGCGKTTIYNILTQALSDLSDNNPKYIITRMNPKSIKGTEMYGTLN